MRGRFWCGLHTTTLALLPLVLGGHARAAENEPKVITLSCDGMLTPTYSANKPAMPQSAQKSTVIVNLDDQTIFFPGLRHPDRGRGWGEHPFRRKADCRLRFQHGHQWQH
jgi:hypothetical protein